MEKSRHSWSNLRALILCLSLVSVSTGCANIRLRYDAKVELEGGKSTNYTYEKSYDVGSYPTLCALTGIFLGGACWFYTVMPTVGQKTALKTDAEEALETTLKGKKYEVQSYKTRQDGWGELEPKSTLTH